MNILLQKKAIISATLFLFIITGCMQPNFNPNNKGIVFKNGKPYSIPYNANYAIVDSKDVTIFKNLFGLSCRKGDLYWSYKLHEQLKKGLAIKSEKEKLKVLNAYYKAGKIGCTRPLGKREYNYLLNQQNQRASQQASMNYNTQQNLNRMNYNTQQMNYNTQQVLNRIHTYDVKVY